MTRASPPVSGGSPRARKCLHIAATWRHETAGWAPEDDEALAVGDLSGHTRSSCDAAGDT